MGSFPIQITGWAVEFWQLYQKLWFLQRSWTFLLLIHLMRSEGRISEQPLIFQDKSSNHLIQGQDTWHWYNLRNIGSYLPNLAYTSVTAWFMAKSMSPRPRQKCGKTISTFFNVLLNFSKDYKKQKWHNKQLKPDFFKETQQHEWSSLSCQRNWMFCVLTMEKTEYLSSYAQSICNLECSTAVCWHTLHQTKYLWKTVSGERN